MPSPMTSLSPTRMPERSTPHRDDLCRTATFTLTRSEADSDGDGLTIEGYGAVFNSVTEIDSWEGTFQEVIAPGAFRKSLKERTPKMQFDHGHHPLLGSLPLGRWDVAEEDARGLHLVGRLTDNWLVAPFRDAIRDGGVEGMSFRFSVEREEWTDSKGKKIRDDELAEMLWRGAGDRGPLLRTLKELKVTEAGPVTWPAYETTEVGVRSADAARSSVVTIDLAHINTPQARGDLARAVVIADAAAAAPPDSPDSSPSGQHDSEPQATDRSADEHPTPQVAPRVTDRSAGEHSSTAEIDERRARMRAKAAQVKAAMSRMSPNPKE